MHTARVTPKKSKYQSLNRKRSIQKLPTSAGYVYLIKSGIYHKVGLTKDVESRLRSLQTGSPEKLELIHVWETRNPAKLEAYYHQKFARKRRSGEWFQLDENDIQQFKWQSPLSTPLSPSHPYRALLPSESTIPEQEWSVNSIANLIGYLWQYSDSTRQGLLVAATLLSCVGYIIVMSLGEAVGLLPDDSATENAKAQAPAMTAAVLALTPSDTPTPTATIDPDHVLLTDGSVSLEIERFEVLESAGDKNPDKDVFIVLFGVLHNNSSDEKCIRAASVRLYLDGQEYKPQNGVMDEVKKIIEPKRDFMGAYAGQCIEKRSSELTFVAFDIPREFVESSASFEGKEVDLTSHSAMATFVSTMTPTHTPTASQIPGLELTYMAGTADAFNQKQTPSAQPTQPPVPGFSCDCSKTCDAMASCEEAYFQLNQCGCSERDGDGDGVPCESICPVG